MGSSFLLLFSPLVLLWVHEMALPWRPNKRLRCKTPPPRPPPQIPLPQPVELGEEADTDVKKSVYLVTLPHPRQARSSTGVILVAPESKSKKYVLKCVLDSCLKPMYMDARSIANGAFVQLAQAGNWRELHKENDDGEVHAHDHVALLAEASFRFLPVKRALLERHGLASHWSVTHTGYHSCVRYLVVPSPKKPLACLDHAPELWSAAGEHPLLSDCIHEPVTAAAMAKKRLKLEQVAAEKRKGDPRITDLDVWALVVRSGVRNSSDDRNAHFRLGQYAKAHCGMAMVHHLFRMRHKLPGMIDDIWQWEHINEVVTVTSRSRMQALRASALGPCVCNGAWPAFIVDSFLKNRIDVTQLCRDVCSALDVGRGETTPVIVLAGAFGGEGKSVFLKPLLKVFSMDGMVFCRPGKGNYPLLELPSAKVAFLDEWRWDPDVVPWAVQCLWFDGSAVPITRPQNDQGSKGHFLYQGTAPIFVTCKLPDLEWLESLAAVDEKTGRPYDADASMLLRRLKIYRFATRVAKPACKFPFCASCFSKLLLQQAGMAGV